MAGFSESLHKCVWKLDTQEMVSFDLDSDYNEVPPAVIYSPHTIRVFVPQVTAVEIWEVSTTGSNMVLKIEPPQGWIRSICPSRDGHRLLIGSGDGVVRMLSLEDLGSHQPVTQDQERHIIALSPSGKIVATGSWGDRQLELWDTTTWERVGPRDVEYADDTEIAFSPHDKRIAVLSKSLVTIWDINHPENCLSFDPWSGRSFHSRQAAFQTCNDLVICARLGSDDTSNFDEIPGSLQVWKVKDHSECIFSLDIKIVGRYHSRIFLAPDGLTVIAGCPALCYSWNHDTAQFNPFHFVDGAHLGGAFNAYSPDGKFFACDSPNDDNIRVWNTRTRQLCGKPIKMPRVQSIALSPALNDRSVGDRLIALHDSDKTTILFDVHTGHLYAEFWDLGGTKVFTRDGTKLMSCYPIRIYEIVDLAAKHQNASPEYKRVPDDGWVVGQDNELLFWVPLEHREVLCPSQVVTIWERPPKVDFSNFKFGTEWTECIDKEWLK